MKNGTDAGSWLEISLEDAERLFTEANDFITGKSRLAEDSEIRALAVKVFGNGYSNLLCQVCYEIFRILAEDAHDNWV